MKVDNKIIKIVKWVLCILRWLSLIVYLALIAMSVYDMFQWKKMWRYPHFGINSFLHNCVVFVIVPMCILIFLFYKSKKLWQLILQVVLQILFICFMPGLIFGLWLSFTSAWGSATEELENYYVFDADVAEHLESLSLDIMPESLPQNIEKTEYSYQYFLAIDSVVKIETSWQYVSEEDYEQMKKEMLEREIVETYEEDGYVMNKIQCFSEYNKAEFGYNSENQSVIFRIVGSW